MERETSSGTADALAALAALSAAGDEGADGGPLWVSCDECGKWRRVAELPPADGLPWTCAMNLDDAHNACSIPQELPDDEVDRQMARYHARQASAGALMGGAASIMGGAEPLDRPIVLEAAAGFAAPAADAPGFAAPPTATAAGADGGAVRLHPLEAQLFGGGGVTSAQLPKPAPRPKPPPPAARVMSVAEAERAAASEGIRLLRAEKSPTGFMGVRLREDGKYMAWGSRTDLIGAYTTAAEAALHVARFLSAKKRGETYDAPPEPPPPKPPPPRPKPPPKPKPIPVARPKPAGPPAPTGRPPATTLSEYAAGFASWNQPANLTPWRTPGALPGAGYTSLGAGLLPPQPVEETCAQCERCNKWRRLPAGTDEASLPAVWFCEYNPDVLRNTCAAPEELFDDDAVGATAAPAPLPPPRALPLPRAPPLPKKPAASKKLPVGRQSWPEARKPRANPGQLPPGRKMEGRDGKTWVVVETFEAGRHAWELVGKESPREAADALLMAERRYAAEREERAEQTARAAARKAQGRAQYEADAAAREAEAAARAGGGRGAARGGGGGGYGAAPKANPSQLPVGRKMEGRDGRVWVVVETASVGRHAWECPEDAEERALARAEKKAARAEAKAAKSAKAAAAAAAAALVADSSQEPSRRGSLADSSDAEAAAEAAAMAYDSSGAEETAEAVKSPEKSYEVERIVAYRQKDATGEAEYLVKWKGCATRRVSDEGRLTHTRSPTPLTPLLFPPLYRYGKQHNTWEPIEHLTTPAAKREAAQVKAAATRSARAEQLKRESGGGEVTDLTTKGGSKVGFEVTVPLLCMHKMEHEGGYPLCELPFGHAGPHSTGASLGKRQRAEKKRFDDEAYGPKGGRAKLPGPPPASSKAAKLASVVPERYNAAAPAEAAPAEAEAEAAAAAAAAHPMGYVPKPKPPAAEAKPPAAKAKPKAAAAAENGDDGGEEPVVTPEVTEVDGLQLHLSATNPTGYLGLQVVDGARFRARYGQKHIGTYGTAVEAAMAYAKAVAAAENGDGGGDEEGEGERPSSSATGEEEEGGEGAAEERPERAEGFDLETSSRNSTGYRGVFLSHGKFEARHKSKYIGHFETAVQAAVAYAKAKAAAEEEGGWLERGRSGCSGGWRRATATASSASGPSPSGCPPTVRMRRCGTWRTTTATARTWTRRRSRPRSSCTRR